MSYQSGTNAVQKLSYKAMPCMIKRSQRVLMPAIILLVFPLFAQQFSWPGAGNSSETLQMRFAPPPGFLREAADSGSFANWLRNLPLLPSDTPVRLFNGQLKGNQSAHAAVINIDVGKNDLQQCADAVIRLRAEFLYGDSSREIAFNFTSGDRCSFGEWVEGKRPDIRGNKVFWVHTGRKGRDYGNFSKYLQTIFTYAGTYSLKRELIRVADLEKMEAGDVFIQGGFPGHAVLVADMAVNPQSGRKIYLLLQSYMPAQNIHVLKNPVAPELSPWYEIDHTPQIITPEWTFRPSDLHRFSD